MYTERDIKKLFSQHGEIEMELGILKAMYHNCEAPIPPEVQERLNQLERKLMTIDSMFLALSTNEKFVIQLHVVEQLDWPQVLNEFLNRWGKNSEKTIRSLQICQTKALKKLTKQLNKSKIIPCIEVD